MIRKKEITKSKKLMKLKIGKQQKKSIKQKAASLKKQN